jgi:hypothetical protein
MKVHIVIMDEWPKIKSRAQREQLWESTRMGQWWLRQVDRHHRLLFGTAINKPMTPEQRAANNRLNALYDYRDEVMNSNDIPYEVPEGYTTEGNS